MAESKTQSNKLAESRYSNTSPNISIQLTWRAPISRQLRLNDTPAVNTYENSIDVLHSMEVDPKIIEEAKTPNQIQIFNKKKQFGRNGNMPQPQKK